MKALGKAEEGKDPTSLPEDLDTFVRAAMRGGAGRLVRERARLVCTYTYSEEAGFPVAPGSLLKMAK